MTGAQETRHGKDALDGVITALFVPAVQPDRFEKALGSGADAVIIDLEDAVASAAKSAAREMLRDRLPYLDRRVPVGIRVNAMSTAHVDLDVALVGELIGSLDFLVLPEVQGPGEVNAFLALLRSVSSPDEVDRISILALIESSAGLLNAPAIASVPEVRRLALGSADLAEEWDVAPSAEGREFDFALQQLVVASRASELNGPIDSPHMNVQDHAGLSRRAASAAGLGVKGKLCIHPAQVKPAAAAFVVSGDEYLRLQEVIEVFARMEATGDSSVRLSDGSFVDYPVYRRAIRQVSAYEKVHKR